MLTNIPKLCMALKLREVRFAYHPLATIESKAFDHLPSLEDLDMAGNGPSTPGFEQTMKVLESIKNDHARDGNLTSVKLSEKHLFLGFESGLLKMYETETFKY